MNENAALANTAFMISPIGDLTVDAAGLRAAIDEICRLRDAINEFITEKPAELTSPIGMLTADTKGLRTAIDEIGRCHAEIERLKSREENRS